MKAYFSARHRDALDSKQLTVSLAKQLRIGLERILSKRSNWGGWDDRENYTYQAAEEELTTFYGRRPRAYGDGDQLGEADLGEVIRTGYPTQVLDAVEAWFEVAPDGTDREAESEINALLAIHRSEWRFVNGTAIRMDSEYLHQEVVAGAVRLMGEVHAAGAQEEFQAALAALDSGDFKKAVTEAHKSVESTMKCVLERQTGNFGGLLADVVKSGIVPEYYREFLAHFQKLALGAVKERNLPGRGHGQGAEPQEVTPGLARFALHLAGAINVFLLERWLETKRETEEETPSVDDDEIPF
jgi:Domain of unknown function (DUF7014)